MKKRTRTKTKQEPKDLVLSEICIETEDKDNIFSIDKNANKFHKKDKIFMTKKRERFKASPGRHYFFNNGNDKFFSNYKNQFGKKGAFNFFVKTQNPFMNHYFYNIKKKQNESRQIQTTLIINNYINIENSHEQNENKENSFSTTQKMKYFESPSISTSNSIQFKSNQKENISPKNKFNVIKEYDENYEKIKILNENKKRGRKSKR